MLMNVKLKNLLMNISCMSLLIVLLVSCVGEIEDKNPDTTKTSAGSFAPIKFIGIDRAVAVADDKVEVYFFPGNGEAANTTYIITYDGLANPITVSGSFLVLDYRGLLSYTVTGLNSNTRYSFDVQAYDNTTKIQSESKEKRTVQTFANITSDFSGIAVAKNISGADGMTSVRIEWPEAYRGNPLLPPTERDVVEYEVSLVDSDSLNPGDLNNSLYTDPLRKVIPVPANVVSYVVSGLKPDTKYFVQVRAIHYGATQNSSDPTYRSEVNNKYLEVTTLSANLADLSYDPTEAAAIRASGVAGKSTIEVNWGEVTGSFDHYRVYYTVGGDLNLEGSYMQDDCDSLTVYGGAYRCKKLDYSLNDTILTDLIGYTEYKMRVVICQVATCTAGNRVSFNDITAKTDPPIAEFSGIDLIVPARSDTGLNQVHIGITSPDLNTGVVDGLAVKIFANPGLGITQNYFLNLPDLDGDGSYDDDVLNMPLSTTAEVGSGLSVLPFDYKVASEISVTGIDPFTIETYTFLVVPYLYEGGKVKLFEDNLNTGDITPSIITPSGVEFSGVSQASCDVAPQTLRVQWDEPSLGVYSNYELYLKNDGAVFDFGAGKAGDASYTKVTLPKTAEEYSFAFLPAGTYQVGAVTYLSVGSGYYSENNTNIQQISIPGDCN
jgi:hypothetical protein